ncbi:MAG: hypothetical protein HQ596_02180, partial [Candidatus Saganbacteria bacterium]|nr:hypothetical protein [Candidatus Saganbacteria bacterium]
KIFFDSGLVAKVLASRLHSGKERTVSVVCEEHDFEADLLNKKLKKCIHQKPAEAHPLDAKKMEEIPVEPYDQLTKELRLFVFSTRREKYLCVSGEEGMRAVALAEEIERLATC